jgi:hypothetical protein
MQAGNNLSLHTEEVKLPILAMAKIPKNIKAEPGPDHEILHKPEHETDLTPTIETERKNPIPNMDLDPTPKITRKESRAQGLGLLSSQLTVKTMVPSRKGKTSNGPSCILQLSTSTQSIGGT